MVQPGSGMHLLWSDRLQTTPLGCNNLLFSIIQALPAVAQLVGTTGDGRGVANTRFEVLAGTEWTRSEGPESLAA